MPCDSISLLIAKAFGTFPICKRNVQTGISDYFPFKQVQGYTNNVRPQVQMINQAILFPQSLNQSCTSSILYFIDHASTGVAKH